MLPPSIASIPEAREDYPGSSLAERTARLLSIPDLGPGDLCNIHKYQINSKKETEIGTFLYFTGVDTSNVASIAAHLQSLANLMTSKSQYWFGDKKHWKVPELSYCSYNAFNKVDMRVTVHIPGKLDVVVVNFDGKLIHDKVSGEEMERFWLETFVCGIVRAVLESDDENDMNKVGGGLVEVRKINPFNNGIVSKELLNTFLTGFEELFFQGYKLGCNVDFPQPTLINNYLVDGFMKVIQLTQTYDQALEILARLQKEEPSVISLIAQILLLKQDEVEAVKVMNQGILQNKRDANLLILQTEYILEKKKPELALELAKQAVKSSPSDFKAWSILVKCYIRLGDFENALLTLNSCPMNSHREKYQLKRIVPLKNGSEDLHLPSPTDVTLDEVSNLQSNEISYEQRNLDAQLANLPASSLKSTFAKAYDLLTDIVVKTGWEALLKYRAKVFVMEEEYRKDIRTASVSNGATKESLNGSETVENEDNSSTMAIKSPQKENFEEATLDTVANADVISFEDEFKRKRLCERWLDNLFMLLYEDLRVYTMWQAESLHFQAQQMEYKKTTLEWEILGSIAYRLKHFKEGSIAFNNALTGRFSPKSQREILKYYIMERSKLLTKSSTGLANIHNYTKLMNQLNEKILVSIIKLLVWNHRWYSDFSPGLLLTLSDLVAWEGSIKIQSSVRALYSEQSAITNTSGSSSGDKDHIGNHGITDMMDDLDVDYIKLYKLSNADE